MATKAEVRDRTGNELGILPLGQPLKAQDVTRIESAYDEVYAELKKEGLATWTSTAAIPDELVRFVVTLMADNCLNTYSVPVERFNRIKTDSGENGERAKREIRKFIEPFYVSTDEPTDY